MTSNADVPRPEVTDPRQEDEVRSRKALARRPGDTRLWTRLLAALDAQQNFEELARMIRLLVAAFPGNETALKLGIQFLLRTLRVDEAAGLACELLARSGPEAFPSPLDLRHLRLHPLLRTAGFQCDDSLVDDDPVWNFNAPELGIGLSEPVDVVCLLQQRFHYTIQHEIARQLRNDGHRVIFSEVDWLVATARPRVLLTSEALYHRLPLIRRHAPDCLIVNTRHGLGDKNHAALGASQCDRICVSSEQIARIFTHEYLTPPEKIWVTGYPQMDPLFRTQTGRTPAKPPGVPSSRTVLFAPTYNPILSGAYALKDDVSRLIRRDDTGIRVLIRPHPHLLRDAPFIIDKWCQQARTSPNIEMVTDPALNIMDMFDQCDLMISDVSSVALAWFAVDRPLVCVVDPDRAGSSPRYAPDGLEWQMLKAAHVVQDPETLAPLVHALLERPDPGAKTRSEFANFLFGNLRDGNAAGRIADRITTHLREAPR